MAFDISDISAEIAAAGILRTNKFEVTFTPPPGLKVGTVGSSNPTINFDSLNGIDSVIHLYCEQSNIPGIVLDVAPIRRYGYGPIEKKPFAPTFNDATMVFRSDAGGAVWKYLHSWMRLVVNYQDRNGLNSPDGIMTQQHPFELSYKQDYATDVTVSVFDEKGGDDGNTPAISVVLRQAYPIFIGDIQLAWADKNEYVKFPVTFTFIDWYHDDVNPIRAGAASPSSTTDISVRKAP